MNNDSNRLLNAILEDAAPEEFRASLLAETLRLVRQRRRARIVNRGIVWLALAVALPLLLWRTFQGLPPAPLPLAPILPAQRMESPSYRLVVSRPLDPNLVVLTESGSVNLVTSSSLSVGVIESPAAGGLYHDLSDDELLLLCAGRPAALVRQSSNHAELVFLNPEDRNGFPIQ
jgi:hypothetical protein